MSIAWGDFIQQVRAHRPSELLRALAATSSKTPIGSQTLEDYDGAFPWAYLQLARASLLYGNEWREKPVTSRGLEKLVESFHEALPSRPVGKLNLEMMLAAMLYEQLKFQYHPYHDLARTYCLFVAAPRECGHAFVPDWSEVYGMPLPDRMVNLIAIMTAAQAADGVFRLADHDIESWGKRDPTLTANNVVATLESLSRSVEEHREEMSATEDAIWERFSYNSLAPFPFVRFADQHVSPVVEGVVRSIFPESLYYAGCKHWGKGNAFPDAVGHWVEHYVGQLLKEVPFDRLESEIDYEDGKLTVDWLVETSDVVLLVECKAAKLPISVRSGASDSLVIKKVEKYFAEKIGLAHSQLQTTGDLIEHKHVALSSFSSEKPRLGLIVTLETVIGANAREYSQGYDAADFPVLVVSLRELELLVGLTQQRFVEVLRKLATEPDIWVVEGRLRELLSPCEMRAPKRVLEKAIERLVPEFTVAAG